MGVACRYKVFLYLLEGVGESVLLYQLFFKVYLFILREKAQVREWQGERERERIPSRLCADSTEPDTELDLMNREIMT